MIKTAKIIYVENNRFYQTTFTKHYIHPFVPDAELGTFGIF